MKLILDKLGRIEHAEVEIRPLTVFVGENNTNKTWAAYCLYGLARYLTWRLAPPLGSKFGHGFLPVEPRGVVEAVDRTIHATLEAQPRGADITQFQVHRRTSSWGPGSASSTSPMSLPTSSPPRQTRRRWP